MADQPQVFFLHFEAPHPIEAPFDYEVGHHKQVLLWFRHTASPTQSHWDVTDGKDGADDGKANSEVLQQHRLNHHQTLTLQVPGKPDVTIREISRKPERWEIEQVGGTLHVQVTDAYQLPVFNKAGQRTMHHVVSDSTGAERATIRRFGVYPPTWAYTVALVRGQPPLQVLALTAGIAHRDWLLAEAEGGLGILKSVTDPMNW